MLETGSSIMNQIHKCTLVPTRFFDEKDPRCFLSETFSLVDGEQTAWVEIPAYDSVLVYVKKDERIPAMYKLLCSLESCDEYYKIGASVDGNCLSLAIAKGKELLFANIFPIQDFTTAEYFIFAAMKSLQLNPEVSTIYFPNRLTQEEELSLYRYFKAVDYFVNK